MHRAFPRSPKVLGAILTAGVLALSAPVAAAKAAPEPACANRDAPPPPVDTSENPAPGQAAPTPLSVPAVPVGGHRMAECGLVTPRGAPNPPAGITAASWVLQDLDTGAVLAAQAPHSRQRPASLIKTLLALVVTTTLPPDQVITATTEDAEQECTCVGLVAGGRYTVDQLLHGLLMRSGNDVAHAFATALGGVGPALEQMNATAARIGATDTRAATPSGLDGPGMSTSAYDLSLIFHHAMKQPAFAAAVATKNFEIPATDGTPAIPIVNDNRLLGVYTGFLGGKTGFTDDARHTYVGAAEQKGKRVAIVLVRGEQQPTLLVDQAAKLLDYGFALEANRSEAVGRIAYPSPVTPTTTSEYALPSVSNSPSPGSPQAAEQGDSFGTVGWITALAVLLSIVGGFVLGRQRTKAGGGGH
ncbi:D-alanyl-D-alanine carboxypeptidase [Solihabitans fulvus]|uniref:D-alanyl-D-alanine carboxypeptidase n=1 Tax=Solihabitans fulvus TaxID=1892852 RepID=A0A5B2XA60_9PSEU|nr:serine hydrolase [Solihabitans fulvus]KAA2260467.1 D-alanyl-D-alanine carboxypeptidase [Solihabitans fulvus]